MKPTRSSMRDRDAAEVEGAPDRQPELVVGEHGLVVLEAREAGGLERAVGAPFQQADVDRQDERDEDHQDEQALDQHERDQPEHPLGGEPFAEAVMRATRGPRADRHVGDACGDFRHRSHFVLEPMICQRTRSGSLSRWGEGGGEGVTGLSIDRNPLTPHPLPIRGEGAHGVCGAVNESTAVALAIDNAIRTCRGRCRSPRPCARS